MSSMVKLYKNQNKTTMFQVLYKLNTHMNSNNNNNERTNKTHTINQQTNLKFYRSHVKQAQQQKQQYSSI